MAKGNESLKLDKCNLLFGNNNRSLVNNGKMQFKISEL